MKKIGQWDCGLAATDVLYFTGTLMTFDKQSNGRLIEVES